MGGGDGWENTGLGFRSSIERSRELALSSLSSSSAKAELAVPPKFDDDVGLLEADARCLSVPPGLYR